MMNIKTHFHYPPIPIRSFDWSAVDDNTYDGPGSLIGWGPTEQEAIDDLLERQQIREDEYQLEISEAISCLKVK